VLIIVGGGRTPQAVVAGALDLAGGPAANVLVIPWASHLRGAGGRSARMWRQLGARRVVVLADPDADTALAEVRRADLIWFPGGSQVRLMDGLARRGLVGPIRECFRQGAVVGGTSAGAAVMSAVMLTGARAARHTEAAGLGLWPEVIVDQHYLKRDRRARLTQAVLRHPATPGVGIDEGTAVIVRGRHFEVAGAGEVEVLLSDAGGKGVTTHRLRPGMAFDVPPRKAPTKQAALGQLHGGAVGQHLRRLLGKLRGVVAHGDDGVGPPLLGVLHHALVGLLAGGLADVGVRLDVAADDLLEAAEKALRDARRADHNAAHDAQVAGNRTPGHVIPGCHNHRTSSGA
jgi:cyanophycinase